jgi:hypothetical protein
MPRQKTRKRKYLLWRITLLASLVLIVVGLFAPSITIRKESVSACLIPYNTLHIAIQEINSSLKVKDIVVIYSKCTTTECSSTSSTISISINDLREGAKTIVLGPSMFNNIVAELETGETLPASNAKSTGIHGSSLLFTWNYPSLKMLLYVGMYAKKAYISTDYPLFGYESPRQCIAKHISEEKGTTIGVLVCSKNLYEIQLDFTRRQYLGLLVQKAEVESYACPTTLQLRTYIDTALILEAVASLLLASLILTYFKNRKKTI